MAHNKHVIDGINKDLQLRTKEEWLAIQLSGGMHYEENRFYAGHNKGLLFLIQTARQHVLNK